MEEKILVLNEENTSKVLAYVNDLKKKNDNLMNELSNYSVDLQIATERANKLQVERDELKQENEMLKIKCDLLTNKKLIEKDKNAKEIEIKGYYALYKEAKQTIDKIIKHIQSKISNDYDEQDCCINAIDEFCVELLDFIEEVNK